MTVEFLQILLYSTWRMRQFGANTHKKDTNHRGRYEKEAEREARTMWQFVRTFLKWLIIAGVTGGIGGLVGSAFHLSVNWAATFRAAHPVAAVAAAVGGLLIAAIYRLTKMENKNTNAIIDAIHFGDKVPLLLVPAIYLSTVITHLFGGSAGREGAALQIGGSLGCYIGQLFHLDEKDMRIATLCGMSAVFSALFGTPLTATIFALEVISVGVFYYSALVPCIVASLAALAISNAFGIAPTQFTFALTAVPKLLLLRVAALAAVCSLMSILFCVTMHGTERLFASRIPNTWLRIAAGGAIVVVLSLLVGTGDYNGAGMDVITRAIEGGQAAPGRVFLEAAVHGRHHRQRVQGRRGRADVFHRRHARLRARRAAWYSGRICRGARARVRVLRRGQLPDRVNGAEHRTLRRGAARVLRARVRHRLHALGLLWALQQPEDPLFQAPDGVYQYPREIKCKRHARTRNVSGHFF